MIKYTSFLELTAAKLFELQEAVQRVRELHNSTGYKGYSHLKSETGLWCAACDESSMGEYGMPWPCPTIKALDGDYE